MGWYAEYLKKAKKSISFVSERFDITLYLSDIACIEACLKSTVVHARNRQLTTSQPLSQFEAELANEPAFLRIDRGLLVNFGSIEQWDEESLYFKNEERLALPVRNRKKVLQQIEDCYWLFLHLVPEETNAGIEVAAKEQKKQLHKAEKRIAELDGLIKKLYEGNATGKIPDKHFNRMLTEYDKEQSSLEQEFSELQQAISAQKQDYENPQRFIALVKRHTDFTELTTPMLNEFIEKVIVHEATGDRAHRKQKADIYFNFIGNFVPPKQEPDAPTLTAEQQEVERKKEVLCDREREQNRLRMQRVRAAQKAALQVENIATGIISSSRLLN